MGSELEEIINNNNMKNKNVMHKTETKQDQNIFSVNFDILEKEIFFSLSLESIYSFSKFDYK